MNGDGSATVCGVWGVQSCFKLGGKENVVGRGDCKIGHVSNSQNTPTFGKKHYIHVHEKHVHPLRKIKCPD